MTTATKSAKAARPRTQRRRAVPGLIQNFVLAQQPAEASRAQPAVRKPLCTMTWQGTTISKYADGYHARLASGREVSAASAFGLIRGLLG